MSANWSTQSERLHSAMAQAVRDHWLLFLIEGAILLVLGALALVVPPLATLAFTVFLGWLFVIGGAVGLITTFGARHAPGFWWALISAVLTLIVGVLLIVLPVNGAISLTLVLTAFFIIDGVAEIMYALAHRKQLTGQWIWLLADGVIDLFIAALIIIGFPGTVAWALGVLVGIYMIFGGTALIVVALSARSTTVGPARETIGTAFSR